MKIKYTENVDNILKIQDVAIRATGRARELVQVALVATCIHLGKYHDVRVARRLVDGLHETVRGKAVVEFLTKYGHLTVGEALIERGGKMVATKTFVSITGERDEHEAAIRATLDEAKNTPWWTLKPEDAFKVASLETDLSNLIARYERMVKKIKDGKALPGSVEIAVNDATIQAMMRLCNFEAVIDGGNEAQARAA